MNTKHLLIFLFIFLVLILGIFGLVLEKEGIISVNDSSSFFVKSVSRHAELETNTATYTNTGKTICENRICKFTSGDYVYEDGTWKDWRDVKSLINDSRWTCKGIKNVSTDPDVECLDFHYDKKNYAWNVTFKTTSKEISKATSYPIKIVSGSRTTNLGSIDLASSSDSKTTNAVYKLGETIHIGESSTIIVIGKSDLNSTLKHNNDDASSGLGTFYVQDDNVCDGSGFCTVTGITINISDIPDTATISQVRWRGMAGLDVAAPPTCEVAERAFSVNDNGLIHLTNFDKNLSFYDTGTSNSLYLNITTNRSNYANINTTEFNCFCPGSTEWGGIGGTCAVGHNSSQWTTLGGTANSDLQASLGNDYWNLGLRANNSLWKEFTSSPPQHDYQFEITYSEAGAGGELEFSGCANLNVADTIYKLTANITEATANVSGYYCIRIANTNITLDCDGHMIDGRDGASTYGVGIYTAPFATIKNCYINDWGRNIYIYGSRNGTIYNNVITSPVYNNINSASTSNHQFNISHNNLTSGRTGGTNAQIMFYGATWTIQNNNVQGGINNYALYPRTSSDTTLIYNNILNTSYFFYLTTLTNKAQLNVSKTLGTNIIGGTYIGGNFYSNGTTQGYSDTCLDVGGDGICDNPYIPNPSYTYIVDYFPLRQAGADTIAPSISWLSPQNNSVMNGNILLYVSSTDNYGVQNVNFSYKNASLGWTQLAIDTTGPYQTLWGTLNIGSGEYTIQANSSDGINSNSSYITINIDKDVPYIESIETLYPNSHTAVRDGENASFRLNTTDGSGAGIGNATIYIKNINGTSKNYTMNNISGSVISGAYSYWEYNTSTKTTTGTKLIPFYVFDKLNNIALGNVFTLEVDNDVPLYSGLGATEGALNNTIAIFQVQATDRKLTAINFSSNITGTWVNESIAGVSGASYLATISKTVYHGNWSYRFYIQDEVGFVNQTETRNIEVFNPTTAGTLNIYLLYPNTDIFSTNLMWNLSYNFYGKNVTNCSLYLNSDYNSTQTSLNEYTIYNFTNINLSIGTWNWEVKCVDNETFEERGSEARLINILDWAYPIFSDIWSNNKTLNNNASQFNSTITHTNGTSGIEISGTNYTVQNFSLNSFNLTINLSTGTYPYYWWAYGNGSSSLYNWSLVYYHSVLTPADNYPSVLFSYQIPPDLNLSNFIGPTGVNITYNISDDIGLSTEASSIRLYYKANSTISNIDFYQNGTSYSGYFGENYTRNVSSEFYWNLKDNQVLPGTYNFGQVTMENTPHSFGTLTGAGDYVSVELLNVTNATYGFYEMMINRSASTGSLRFYYCNSTYSFANSPAGNPNCFQFYTLTNTTYDHRHTVNSAHMVIPFSVNKTTGNIGTTYVTSTSFFIARGTTGQTWDYYNITNATRTNAFKTTENNGLTWTSRTYTIDAHLHQYGNTSLWYYACANDTANQRNCSAPRQDLFEFAGIAPDSPYVYSPNETRYYKNLVNISINYTAAVSPNGYAIHLYNLTLLNTSYSYNLTISTNNSINLGYNWDIKDVANGEYIVQVEACDILSQCSIGYSSNFTISNTSDNEYPQFSSFYDNNATLVTSGIARFNVTVINTNGTVFLSLNGTNFTAGNVSNNFNVTISWTNGTFPYYWGAWGNGTSHNYNISETFYYTLNNTPADTTPPWFTNMQNHTSAVNNSFLFTYTASDNVAVSCWSLNQTTNFTINCSGYISNSSALDHLVIYYLNVSVNDTSNNWNSSIIFINITAELNYLNLTIYYPSNSTYTTSTIDLNVSAFSNLAISTYWYSLDGSNNISFNPNITLHSLGFEAYHDIIIYVNNTDNNLAIGNVRFYVGTANTWFYFYILMLAVGFILFLFGYYREDNIFIILSSFLFIGFSVVFAIVGYPEFNNSTLRLFIILIPLSFGFYIMIRSAFKIMEEGI